MLFDIEIDQRDSDKIIEVTAALEANSGGIKRGDIGAPECFCAVLRRSWMGRRSWSVLSAGDVLHRQMFKKTAERRLTSVLSDLDPEILPEEVKSGRNDAIIATGCSDCPNQVTNVLCFPSHFPRCARSRRDDYCEGDADRRGACSLPACA
jgi:malic enzyme